MKLRSRKDYRQRRHRRVRKRVSGTAERPRMAVSVSNRHVNVQFIDDDAARTIAAASTMGTDSKANVEAATVVGQRAAEAALAKGIRAVVVDRGGHAFHGRVKATVDAVLAAGISTGGAQPAADAAAPDTTGTDEPKEEK